MNEIIRRIERQIGVPDLASLLAEKLEPTDLQSLLLEVYRLRAQRREPSAVLAELERNRFVRPSLGASSRLLAWEAAAAGVLPSAFELVDLSPVSPLGTCSVVVPVSQNWSVATIRNTEVVSDPTNVLALECALRRRDLLRQRDGARVVVHLATRHRALRAQRYASPAASTHFSLFALGKADDQRCRE